MKIEEIQEKLNKLTIEELTLENLDDRIQSYKNLKTLLKTYLWKFREPLRQAPWRSTNFNCEVSIKSFLKIRKEHPQLKIESFVDAKGKEGLRDKIVKLKGLAMDLHPYVFPTITQLPVGERFSTNLNF